MDKIIHISPQITTGIKVISEFANAETFLKHLQPVDYHFALFSTLYQCGVDFIQLDRTTLPESVNQHPFWSQRLIQMEDKYWKVCRTKAETILEHNFNFELDKKFRAPQYPNLLDQLTTLFYSTHTGIPYVNPEFSEFRNFEFLESRLTKKLFISIKNFYSIIEPGSVTTITPVYSALKKDVRRFEDIVHSTLYSRYAISLSLLPKTSKVDLIKKDIRASSLKLYSKYGKQLEMKETAFGFLKFSKKIMDLFVNKFASLLGDYLIESLQNVSSTRKRVTFYNIKEAHYMIQWANRIGELMQKAGKDKIGDFLMEIDRNRAREL